MDIFSIPDEQILEHLVADLTPYAGMPMPPPPEFLAERYREATSLARVLWKRPYDLKLHKWLHRIAAPTLILWGEADRIVPVEQAPIWADYIPNSQVRTIPGAGHLIFDESAEAAAGRRRAHGRGGRRLARVGAQSGSGPECGITSRAARRAAGRRRSGSRRR